MATHYEINPDPASLPLSLSQEALRLARGLQTANAGSVWIPNGDGTGTLIGEGAGYDSNGNPNGMLQWVGDKVEPGRPLGVSAACKSGIITISWGGWLEGGIPADFDHVEALAHRSGDPEVQVGVLTGAGAVGSGLLPEGSYDVWCVAVDVPGNRSKDSDHVTVVVDDPVAVIRGQAEQASKKADAAVDGMEQVRKDAENGVKEAKDAAASAGSKAQSAIDGLEQVRDDAVKGVKEAKDAANTAQSAAASAASKADKLSQDLDGTKAVVEQHTTKLGEVETKVGNSLEHADQALSAATRAVQTSTEVKTTADRAYSDAQSALTQSSTAVQTAGEVKTTLETNYYSRKDSDAAYASKSELKQTSDGITSTVEKTYATKSALEALRNIADNAVETWTGSQKPTASNAPASTWATDALRKQHAGDVYYDLTSGYSYRWGSTDGKTYTWSLIKDSDITKAIADAAKAQSTANGAQKGVDKLNTDIPVTYATKSQLTQTSESITAKVAEAQRVGQSALDKASTVEQTANGLRATVSEQARTIKGQTTTIGQLTAKADSLTSTLTQTNQRIDSISVGARNLLAKRDMVNGYLGVSDGSLIGGGHASGENLGDVTSGWIPVTAGKPMCLTLYDGFTDTAHSGRYWFYNADRRSVKGVEWNPRTPGTVKFTVPDGAAWMRVTAINASNATSPRYKLETGSIPTDWTPAPEDTAQGIADANTRTSKLEQSLNGFKTSVAQTYETKSDSLKKQSTLQQNLDGFKTSVSNTYLSKTDASKTYATQSSLTQTSESLTAKINSAATTANNALGKATSVEATANGLKTTVSEQASTLKGHTSTISQLTQKADSLSSTITQTNQKADMALANGPNLVSNGDFETGDMTGWTRWDGDWHVNAVNGAHSGTHCLACTRASRSGVNSNSFSVSAGETYRLSLWARIGSNAGPLGGRFSLEGTKRGASARTRLGEASLPVNGWTWTRYSTTVTVPDGFSRMHVNIEMDAGGTENVNIDDVTVVNVTEAKDAQATADTAISRASTLEQSLNGFKTSVSQTYETKSDSLAKKTALEQSLDSFKTTVSNTYSTKSALDGLSAMASKTWPFNKDASSNPRKDWVRLGTLTSAGDSSNVQIDVLTGDGWNGGAWQNSRLSIVVKDAWQPSPSTSNAFGVSVLRENCQSAQVTVMALAADRCEIWCHLPWHYGSGQYTLSGSYKTWSNNTLSQSGAPTSGTSQEVAYRLNAEQLQSDVAATYATKTSVEQTATSIKSSVSETYATKTTVQNLSTTLTQTKDSLTLSINNAQSTANTAKNNAADAQNRVGSLETCIKMTSSGVRVGRIKNGSFTGYSALVNSAGSFDVLDSAGKTLARFSSTGLTASGNLNITGKKLLLAGVPLYRDSSLDWKATSGWWSASLTHLGGVLYRLRFAGTINGGIVEQKWATMINDLPYDFTYSNAAGIMHVAGAIVGTCSMQVENKVMQFSCTTYTASVSIDVSSMVVRRI